MLLAAISYLNKHHGRKLIFPVSLKKRGTNINSLTCVPSIILEIVSLIYSLFLFRFLYCGKIEMTKANAFKFLPAAVQFKVEYLEQNCVDLISESIDKDNVCYHMNHAVKFNSECYKKVCLKIFEEHTAGVIESKSLNELSQPALSDFLDAEKINVLEIFLFNNLILWMKSKCREAGIVSTGENMREMIGDAVFKIRFPTMTVQDFANSVNTIEGFLSESEKLLIYQKITVFDNKKIECPFSSQFRCQKSYFYTPVQVMRGLQQRTVLHRCTGNREEAFSIRSLVDHVENLGDGKEMFTSSLRLYVQCCADMANSTDLINNTKQANVAQRKELSKKLEKWEAACASKEANVCEMMTSFMDFRSELDKLTRWSL